MNWKVILLLIIVGLVAGTLVALYVPSFAEILLRMHPIPQH